MKRATIYARVSTKDQNVEGQLLDLRSYADARGLQVIMEYVDIASGSRADRQNYLRLLNDVRKRKTDVILVWRFDRFARSTRELINALEEFNSLDVDFISFKENVDTSTLQEYNLWGFFVLVIPWEVSLRNSLRPKYL